MKILLLGKSGQVGRALQEPLSLLGELVALDRQAIDLQHLDDLRQCVRAHQPKVIVNAAAYTAVDQAESMPQQAQLINEEAVRVLAEETAKLNAWLVHYSTDYVFDGLQSHAYVETDPTNPLNVYGHTKRSGEQAIQNSHCQHLIFRTSWLYSPHGSNFPLTILKRAREGIPLNVIEDAFGAPTSARLIAEATALALYRVLHDPQAANTAVGLYHVSASDETSWYEYAQFLIRLAKEKKLPLKITPEDIRPIRSENYQSVATRPKNSRLNHQKWTKQFGLVLPSWQDGITQLMDTIGHQGIPL